MRTHRTTVIAALAFLTTVAVACMAGKAAFAGASQPIADLQGVSRAIPEPATKATVLFFIAHDCPVSLSYLPEMNRICRAYEPKSVGFYVVYAEPDYSVSAARKHAHSYGFACPAVLDSKLALSHKYGATITPEAVVLSAGATVLYRGRIDNLYADYGVRRAHATTHDLTSALDDILSGKPAPKPWANSVGCYIQSL